MNKKRRGCYWLLVGLFVSLAVAAMIQTRNGSFEQFYQDGYADDWSMVWMMQATGTGKYDAGRNVSVLGAGSGTINITKEKLDKNANLLEIDLLDIGGNGSLWSVCYLDENMNLLESESFEAESGKYLIQIKDLDYGYFSLILMDDRDVEVKVNSIRILEYEENTTFREILPTWVICYFVYCIIYIVFLKTVRWKKVDCWDVAAALERQADYILDYMSVCKSGKVYSRKIRVFLFAWIVIGWRIANEYGVNKYYGFIVLYTVILFAALIYSIPVEDIKRKMNTSLVNIWLLVFAFQFVSDLMTKKNYGFCEVWMFVCFGLLFRAWSRMKKPEELLEDFAYSILILNIFNILYFYFGNGELYFDGRPTGTWSNPNPFSICVVLCQAMMLFLIYRAVKEKRKWWDFIVPGVEFVFGVWMIYKTQCRTAWLALAIMILWFGVYLISGKVNIKKKTWIVLIVCCVAVLMLGGLWLVLRGGMTFSKREIDTTSANGITSGRVWIWKEYISHMNLLGHEKYLVVGDKNWFAHNGIVKNFYKFGLFAGIAHLIMLIEVVVTAFYYWIKNKSGKYTVFVMGVLIAYMVPSMMESIDELPMVWVGWFAFYFMIGYLMQEDGIRKQESEKYE